MKDKVYLIGHGVSPSMAEMMGELLARRGMSLNVTIPERKDQMPAIPPELVIPIAIRKQEQLVDPTIYVSPEERGKIRNEQKHKATCAKNRKKRMSKKRK